MTSWWGEWQSTDVPRHREDLTLREAALKLGFVTPAQFDAWVRPEDMLTRWHPPAPHL